MAITATSAGTVLNDPTLVKLLVGSTTYLAKSLRGPARNGLVALQALVEGYGPYIRETHDRVSTIKTFVNPSQPVRLLDHFVSPMLISEKSVQITDQDLLSKLEKPCRIVISAMAGYGKSVLMRYIALQSFENPNGRLPLFVELRELNRITSPNILSYIHSVYKREGKFAQDVFTKGLEAGAFTLILDGFDEVNYDIRSDLESQIIEIAQNYRKTPIIVSGRPDEKFSSWRAFQTYQIAPMTKDQIIELVSKLEYTPLVKDKFLEKIGDGLFELHESFLSTPLLATLMLLTFEQYANVPDKMHLFYANAFETLFYRHDALKELYDRKRKSNLRVDELSKIFAAFCMISYVRQNVEFTKQQFLTLICEALSYQIYAVDPEELLFDLTESVCLIQKEGPSYSFVHRSFQEYFSAVFLSSCAEDVRDQFLDSVTVRYWDNVLPMLFDMAADQLEPTWVASRLDNFIGRVDASQHPEMYYIKSRFKSIIIVKRNDSIAFNHLGEGRDSHLLNTVRRFYPSLFGHAVPDFRMVDLNVLVVDLSDYIDWSVARLVENTGKHTFSVYELMIDDRHSDALEKSGFFSIAKAELATLKQIRQGIDDSQGSRNEFLDRLLRPPKTTKRN